MSGNTCFANIHTAVESVAQKVGRAETLASTNSWNRVQTTQIGESSLSDPPKGVPNFLEAPKGNVSQLC